jgi:ATP-dependent DNA helicase RecG
VAVRPVHGVDESELDGIQKDMVGFNHKIQPTYAAKVAIEKADRRTLVVL